MRPKKEEVKVEITEVKTKQLKSRRLPSGMYSLFYEGGGELPGVLTGSYTSLFQCQKAIDDYLRTK
jgi:hypothetical protein